MTQDEVKEATQALLAWGHAALEPKQELEAEELKARAPAESRLSHRFLTSKRAVFFVNARILGENVSQSRQSGCSFRARCGHVQRAPGAGVSFSSLKGG